MPILAQVPMREGFNAFTYLGTETGPISTYNAFLSGVVAGDLNGGSPDVYSPVNPFFANDFNNFVQNRTYIVFAKQNFNIGLSGTYIPAQPARFTMVPGFNTFGFDYNCVRTPLSTFRNRGIYTAYARNPDVAAGLDVSIYIDAIPPGIPQPYGLEYLEPLSSYALNASTNVVLSAERIFNLLITESGTFIITNPPVSGIRV